MTLEQSNKAIIILAIAGSFAMTAVLAYYSGGSATISWQIYQYAKNYPEISLFIGIGAGRFFTKLEYNAYD